LRLIDLLDGDLSQLTNATFIKDLEITGLTCDSRKVSPGFLFAAIPGSSSDGRDYIDDALKRGASAVLAPVGTSGDGDTVVVTSENTRQSYAQMAARFFDKQPPRIAAITGTNGKTSVVSFVRQIWEILGSKAASLGTLGIVAPGFQTSEGLTTPDPGDLHESLAVLWKRGVETLAMEASSHGLDQYRLDGVNVSMAGFTNLSRDHLDYHGSMEKYLDAKKRLFSEILPVDGVSILNADSEVYLVLVEAARGRIISYGRKGKDIRLDDLQVFEDGHLLSLNVMGDSYKITLPLSGAFQVENAMCALGVILADGADPATAVKTLENLQGVPGRLQHVANSPDGAAIYVDFAHTPNALATVLKTLRPHAKGSLNVVFGCGGERDAGKRHEMGRIASELADKIIITDDNPRSEDAATIRAQSLAGCPGALEVGGRSQAIRQAIAQLQKGDVLVIAGKGHETGQIIAGVVHPFNDAEEIRAALREVRS
jgi:UDP-N-acetylmuramoyl-L-alanyl-D-glutamate--2,6-diaminopimelate ligase